MDPAGKVCLVTGSAKRVGKAIALALAERGASLAVHYRASKREAEAAAAAIRRSGAHARTFQADLARAADCKRLVREVLRAFGVIDVLVNNASVFFKTPYAALDEKAWNETLDANLRAPFLLCKYAGDAMLRQKGGAIVNIADWAGLRPYRDYLPYCVSKGGLITMTKAFARELAPHVRVNAVCPGPVMFPENFSEAERREALARVPLKRAGSPEDVASAVLYFIESEFATGAVLPVDGGRSVA